MIHTSTWYLSSAKYQQDNYLPYQDTRILSMLCKSMHYHDPYVSYYDIHKTTKRATPEMLYKYKLSLLL
jgi:hypothetical protein